MTRIKFCGLTGICDIEAANALRPDYIGFVFAKGSKRFVTPEQAARLKRVLDPEIRAVGVFVNEAPENISALLNRGVIDIAQLHGREDEPYLRRLRTLTGKPVIQAFRIRNDGDLRAAERSSADEILLDSGAGTGETLDWKLLKNFPRRYFLAGGLTPENVREAISLLNPFAVDISSGIETDGRKDRIKMTAFAANVRGQE